MHIALDAICLSGMRGGFNRYVQQVLDVLAADGGRHDYELILNRGAREIRLPDQARIAVRRVSTPPRLQHYWSQISPAVWALSRRFDVWHSLLAPPPLLCAAPTVATVHDLSFERYPDMFSRAALFYWRRFLPEALKRAAVVVTDSECTRGDVLRYYGLPPDKVRVVYPWISLGEGDAQPEDVAERYRLPAEYFLYAGSMHPRKDLKTLIRAFTLVKQRTRLPHGLVLAGPGGWGAADVAKEVAASEFSNEVLRLGAVPNEDLPALFRGAAAFVYPSLYEGFGYPPLEAMGYGIPAIVSDASCLPEVVGDAGLTFRAASVEALADAMTAVVTNPAMADRLRRLGQQRVVRFSPDAMLRGIQEAYDAAASGS